jgi:predicted O-methyltransferase YrrM
MDLKKLSRLFALLPTKPLEFYDRIMHFVEVKYDEKFSQAPVYMNSMEYEEARAQIINFLNPLMDQEQGGLLEIENEVHKSLKKLISSAPFRLTHSGDLGLARFCYLITRAISPDIVIETGVAFGKTSAFILKAMEENGNGVLHSIDLPPLGDKADSYIGFFIPDELKNRWVLHRGSVRRILPGLLKRVGEIDLFVHDSLHTYSNMLWEFNTATPFLRKGSIIISDDIAQNRSLEVWIKNNDPLNHYIIEKINGSGLFGIVIKKE